MTHSAIVATEVHLMMMTVAATDDAVVAVAYVSLLSWPAIYMSLYLPTRYALVHGTMLTAFAWTTLSGQLGAVQTITVLLVAAPVFCGMALICSRLAAQLRDQASRDSLTGLLNRRGLDDAAARITSSSNRSAAEWAVVAIDLDGFKSVNDRLGHPSGDALLTDVALAWSGIARRGDVLARTGGDEFVLLLPGNVEDAVAMVNRLRGTTPELVGLSAGVSAWPVSSGLAHALRSADTALYRAKNGARGTTVLALSSSSPAEGVHGPLSGAPAEMAAYSSPTVVT